MCCAKCPFCQSAQDSIEHFVRCSMVTELYQRHAINLDSIDEFLLISQCKRRQSLLAFLLAAVYRARNTLTHAHEPLIAADVLLESYKALKARSP